MRFGGLFGRSGSSEETTRLNLESAAPIAVSSTETVQPKSKPVNSSATEPAQSDLPPQVAERRKEQQARQAAFDKSPVAEMLRLRADALLQSADLPEAVYFAQHPGSATPLGLVSADTKKGIVLLFSSPILARHYFRPWTSFTLCEVTIGGMEGTVQSWKKQGYDAYLFDPAPKKAHPPLIMPADGVINREMVLRSWAASRVLRNALAEVWHDEYVAGSKTGAMHPETLQKQRVALENLRDMGASDVPFVHWVIALIARLQGDEPGRLASTEALEEFGPSFVGKTLSFASRTDTEEKVHDYTDGYLGLLAEFGFLKGPDGKPVGSVLRVDRTPIASA